MTCPKSLAALLKIAKAKVSDLEHQYQQAAARAARSGTGPDVSKKIIIECALAKARSRLASLQMQAKRELREQKLAQ